jgi:crotonobetainyl-CoA:carnitine CoA-transferase CaiB-like acyl-CoA transferase
MRQPRPPVRTGGATEPAPAPAPDLGADGAALLADAGFDAAEIAALREAGVLR